MAFGAEFKDQMTSTRRLEHGTGRFWRNVPYFENKVYIDKTKKDKWGQPVLAIDCEFKDNENKMRVDMMNDAAEMLEAAGMKRCKDL